MIKEILLEVTSLLSGCTMAFFALFQLADHPCLALPILIVALYSFFYIPYVYKHVKHKDIANILMILLNLSVLALVMTIGIKPGIFDMQTNIVFLCISILNIILTWTLFKNEMRK